MYARVILMGTVMLMAQTSPYLRLTLEERIAHISIRWNKTKKALKGSRSCGYLNFFNTIRFLALLEMTILDSFRSGSYIGLQIMKGGDG